MGLGQNEDASRPHGLELMESSTDHRQVAVSDDRVHPVFEILDRLNHRPTQVTDKVDHFF
jgi:hypothetical protein